MLNYGTWNSRPKREHCWTLHSEPGMHARCMWFLLTYHMANVKSYGKGLTSYPSSDDHAVLLWLSRAGFAKLWLFANIYKTIARMGAPKGYLFSCLASVSDCTQATLPLCLKFVFTGAQRFHPGPCRVHYYARQTPCMMMIMPDNRWASGIQIETSLLVREVWGCWTDGSFASTGLPHFLLKILTAENAHDGDFGLSSYVCCICIREHDLCWLCIWMHATFAHVVHVKMVSYLDD